MEKLILTIVNLIKINYNYFIIFIILLTIVLYLVITDNRFSIKNKIIFILISFLFLILSIFIQKTPILIIRDLF